MRSALQYLQTRARTERETRDKLERQGFPADTVSYIIDRLKARRVLDDARFASEWIQSRARKALGERRIRRELRNKGIEDGLIDAAFEASSHIIETDGDTDAVGYALSGAVEFAKRGLRRLRGQSDADIKRKLTQSLVRRGFSFSDAREAVIQAMTDEPAE